ncbi:hypothetical protein ACFRAR_17815 [Kitasatospora sp. NPDC056651]|uniref:hypothetical protein n=1 Tax=Kitasatospora sp. NPDC056651 TaxID=3345892 RepID=UPI0036C55A83
MPINDAVPAPPPHGSPPPCPGCAMTDQVRRVPAVHLGERRSVTVRSSGRDGRSGGTETREEVSALGRALAPAPPTTGPAVQALVPLAFAAMLGAVFTFVEGMRQRDAATTHTPDFSPPDWVTKNPGFSGDLPGFPGDFPGDRPSLPGGLHTHLPGFPGADQASPLPEAAAPLADASGTPTVLLVSYLLLAVAVALAAGAIALYRARRRRLAGRPRAERLWNQAWYCARCGTAHFPPTAGQGTGALGLAEFREAVWTAGGYGDLAGRHRA